MKISGSRQIREELRDLNNVLLGFNLCNNVTVSVTLYPRYQLHPTTFTLLFRSLSFKNLPKIKFLTNSNIY